MARTRDLRGLLAIVLWLGCSSGGAAPGNAGAGGAEESGGKGGGGKGAGGRGGSGGQASGGSGGQASGGSGGQASGGQIGAGGSTGDGGSGPGGKGDGGASGGSDAGAPPPDAAGPDTATPGYTGNPFVYVGTGFSGNTIRIFQLDMQSGALTAKGTARSGNAPTYMAFHPSRKFAYALNEDDPGRIQAFAVNAATGALTLLNDAASGGDGPAHLSVHANGKWLFVANYNSGHVAVLPVDPATGRVSEPTDVQKPVNMTAHAIVTDPAGENVFVASTAADRVLQYKLDQQAGKLVPNTPAFIGGQGQSPRHLAFHPDGKNAYAVGESGASVIWFKYDATTGRLSNPVVNKVGGSAGAHIAVHPSGKFLYASIRGGNTLAGFLIGEGGALTPMASRVVGLDVPWDFCIDPTGKYLLVANEGSSSIKVFSIGELAGVLTAVGSGASAPGPHYVGVMFPF